MKKLGIALLSLLLLCACTPNQSTNNSEVVLMLDYVPNTNHTGIYVAQKLGYFEEEGLNVQIIEPGTNETAATMVASGNADFGISYQEDVTYAKTAKEPLPIKAIATIIQHNTSGFVSLKSENIHSPKDFEGKIYAGWQAPSEEAVIEAVMNKANADFSKLTMVGADGSGFASLGNTVDIQWEFEGWAVIKGRLDGYELNYMPLKDLDERLDYYTPVLITNENMIENESETVQKMVNAIKKGYEYAIENPSEAADILAEVLPDTDKNFILESQKFLSQQYALGSDTWGIMKDEVWNNYTDFMYEYELISQKVDASALYTNEFLK